VTGSIGYSGATVEIRYPSSGALAALTTTSAADGSFSIANVPFGVRSIAVTSTPSLNPVQITVDSVNTQLSLAVLDFGTPPEAHVIYVPASRVIGGACGTGLTSQLCLKVNNQYTSALALKSVVVFPDVTNLFIKKFIVNGTTYDLAPTGCATSGGQFDVSSAGLSLPAATNNIPIEIDFSDSATAVTCGTHAKTVTTTNLFQMYLGFSNITTTVDVEF